MARPRIFVSSTYFDLRVLRADIERFVREMGYEAVLFERGHIAYGKEQALEDYCYREISSCDVLVSIIGGKYGTQSRDHKHSITQKEIKSAIELGKQIYVFVERSVLSEYRTYLVNKDNESFNPASVNDKRVFHFLEEIYGLPAGNPIEGFELSEDITRYLKEQWAGLFQRLLQETSRTSEINAIEGIKQTAATLNSLVTYLSDEKVKGDQAINEILLSNHPAFAAVKKVAGIPYRVIFQNVDEVTSLLGARGFEFDPTTNPDNEYQWDNSKAGYGIGISKSIFDDGKKLKIITPEL
jgi:Domain of unknown function (DUF4062)